MREQQRLLALRPRVASDVTTPVSRSKETASEPGLVAPLIPGHDFAELPILPRLDVSEPGEPDELEAERVAGEVTRSTEGTGTPTIQRFSRVRRKPVPPAQAAPEDASEVTADEQPLAGGGARDALIVAATKSSGRPLEPHTRTFFEPRLGFDFSRVRIHADAAAAEAARSIHARAYTIGSDVVFSAGEYDPESTPGHRLLAHELTHVVQQSGQAPGIARDSVFRVSRDPQPAAPPAPAAAAGGERAKIDKALAPGGTANDVKDINDFASATEPEKVTLIKLVMTDWWVGPTGEYAIERCWGSVSKERFVPFVESNKQLWLDSIERGAELEDLKQFKDIQQDFKNDVVATAKGHLTTNGNLVKDEMAKFGIQENAANPVPAPTQQQDDELKKLAEVAKSLSKLEEGQEKAREAVVGWRVGAADEVDPDAHGQLRYPVKFDPKGKPAMDANPDMTIPADIHFGPVVPYEVLKPAYDDVSKSITRITTRYPSLYALHRQDSSATTGAFANATDPKQMREKLGQALRLLAKDITDTQGKLGSDINPLDLAPIHEQLYGGVIPEIGARWQTGFRQEVAKKEVQERKVDQQLLNALVQSGVQFAFLLAPLTPGLIAIAVMAAATGVAGAKAYASADDYQSLATAAKSTPQQGTQIVDDATVDHAKMVADADLVLFALSAVMLGGAVAEFVGARPANSMTLTPQTRQLRVANPQLVAEYEQVATRKLPNIVEEVLGAERSTPGRVRLAQLRGEFDQLRAEVGDATTLTPAQRTRGDAILAEARELAQADFKNLQSKVTKRLRADPELKSIEDRLIAAGDMEDKATGAVRLKTQKGDGTTSFEPVNIEHKIRRSDNPWAAKDADNLLLTDAAQNQQYLEAIRQYGGVWPADVVEEFVIRHQLNRQGIDFRPGPR